MYLLINTCSNERIQVAVADEELKIRKIKIVAAKYKHGEKLLPTIKKVLTLTGLTENTLRGIIIAVGPGGFSSVRIGVVTANALGYTWQLPVVGVKLPVSEGQLKDINWSIEREKLLAKIKNSKSNKIILPEYGSEPHITLKK